MVLLSYSSQAIWKMKRELSSSSKEPVKGIELQKIHDNCAMFSNLYYHPNPCRSDSELELFTDLKSKLKLEQVNNQIINAKELLDYRNELTVSAKSASIDNTVFITGYIGVLFALLGFCNIYGTNIVDLVNPAISGWGYFGLAGLICAVFVISVKIYSCICFCIESLKSKTLSRWCALISWILSFIVVGGVSYILFIICFKLFVIAS